MKNNVRRFHLETNLVPLAISADDAVTGIVFGERGTDEPVTALDRQVADELLEYFAGKRTVFTFPVRTDGTGFERSVWEALTRIPYGHTATYGDIARAVGQPEAARAVGLANHHNPVPIVIPCHRVVAAGGKLGGFGGGVDLKRRLLALEGAGMPALTL